MKENSTDSYYAIIHLFRQVIDSTRLIRWLLIECKEIQKYCYIGKKYYQIKESNLQTSNSPVESYETTHIFYYLLIPNTSSLDTGLAILVPGTTNNSVNVIQNGLKIIH